MEKSEHLKIVICGVALVALASVRPALAQEGDPCIESENPCVTHTFDGGLQTNKYVFGTHAIKITANFSGSFDLGIEFITIDPGDLAPRLIPELSPANCIPYAGATSNTHLGACGYYHVVNPPTPGVDFTGDVIYTVLWDFPTFDALHNVRLYRAPLDGSTNPCTDSFRCYTQDVTTAVIAVGDHNVDAGVKGTGDGFSDFEAVDFDPENVSLSSKAARVWIGLKNSDDVGTRFDLKAVVSKSGVPVSSGELFGALGGSSGFNNARLRTIPLPFPSDAFSSGDPISIEVSVRNSCVGSSHNSGTARLWFNDGAANSRVDEPGVSTLFLRAPLVLDGVGSGPKSSKDIFVGARNLACTGLYTPFGTWTGTVP